MPDKIASWLIMFAFSLSLAMLASMLGVSNIWVIVSIFTVTYFICDMIFTVIE